MDDFSLRRLRRIGLAVLALQLGAMLDWSHFIWARFSLTNDYANAWQAWWSINHGHLNPYDSLAFHPYWQDHFALLLWPFALITHVGMGGYAPLAFQDLLVVATEVIAFVWIIDLLREHDLALPMPNWAVGAASLFLMVANPWVYWAISFDFHPDVMLAAPFVVLALRALYYRRYRQLAVWSVLVLLSGDVAATYLAALGFTGLIVSVVPGQRRVVASASMLLAGVVGFFVIAHVDPVSASSGIINTVATKGGPSTKGATTFSYNSSALSSGLKIVLHPWHLLAAPFHELRNIWALLSPAGVLGLVSLWSLPFAAMTALENTAAGPTFSAVGFQYAAVWAPLVVGGVFSARFLARRRGGRAVVTVLVVASVVNTVGFAAAWLPKVNQQWVRVDAGAAHVLTEANALIPPDAEVIVSQGVIGRFADRKSVFAFPGNGQNTYPITRHTIYFVILPYQGIEVRPVNQSLGLLGNLAGTVGAHLVLHGHGVWVFRLDSESGSGTVDLRAGYDKAAIPVWAARSATGHATFDGPSSNWAMTTSSPAGGYLLYGVYYHKRLGQFDLRVRLSTTGTANVEAWNDDGDVLLARRTVPATNQIRTVDVPVDNLHYYPPPQYRGQFLFKDDPVSPLLGQVVEARIYLPPGTSGTVYSVQLIPVTQ